MHRHRHLVKILLCLLVILKRCIEVVELQIDGCQTQIEGDVLLLRQIERIDQEQGTAIPRCSFRQLVLEEIGISQIGTHHRCLVLGITGQRQAIGFLIKCQCLLTLLVEVMIVGCLRIVGKGEQTVSARWLRLLLGKLHHLIYIRDHGIGSSRQAEILAHTSIILVKGEAIFSRLQSLFYHLASLGWLGSNGIIHLLQGTPILIGVCRASRPLARNNAKYSYHKTGALYGYTIYHLIYFHLGRFQLIIIVHN